MVGLPCSIQQQISSIPSNVQLCYLHLRSIRRQLYVFLSLSLPLPFQCNHKPLTLTSRHLLLPIRRPPHSRHPRHRPKAQHHPRHNLLLLRRRPPRRRLRRPSRPPPLAPIHQLRLRLRLDRHRRRNRLLRRRRRLQRRQYPVPGECEAQRHSRAGDDLYLWLCV